MSDSGMFYEINSEECTVGFLIDSESGFWDYDKDRQLKVLGNASRISEWKRDVLLIKKYFENYSNKFEKRFFMEIIENSSNVGIHADMFSALNDAEINDYVDDELKDICRKEIDILYEVDWKRKNPRSPSKQLRQQIIDRDGLTCFYCKKELSEKEVAIDHVKPYSKHGETSLDNLVVSCKSCNSKKHTKDVEDFINEKDVHKS
ncbi:MAG: HNH endonuclease signature motif containing protein [Candidatus Paceibacterota bacterium]